MLLYIRSGNLDRYYDDDPEEIKEVRKQIIDEFNRAVEESEE